jgi:hypothetical protein
LGAGCRSALLFSLFVTEQRRTTMDTSDSSTRAAERHHRLYMYAAVAGLLRQTAAVFGSIDDVLKQFPFLGAYLTELAAFGLEGIALGKAPAVFRDRVLSWEDEIPSRLPLRALSRSADLGYGDLVATVGATLVDEDIRFGALFTAMHGLAAEPRPTLAMLADWGDVDAGDHPPLVHTQRLLDLGILDTTNPALPASGWCVRLHPALAAAIRGQPTVAPIPGLRHRPLSELPDLAELVLPSAITARATRAQALVGAGDVDTLLIRGARGNGRRSLAFALARSRGQGVLEIDLGTLGGAKGLAPVGPLAALLGAVPVMVLDPAPGEPAAIPALTCAPLWRCVVGGARGGCTGLDAARTAAITLDLPDRGTRRALWQQRIPTLSDGELDDIADRFRLASGTIVRLAGAATVQAKMDGRSSPASGDVARARGLLDRGELDVLATRLTVGGDWNQLVVGHHTRAELGVLEQRCRHRERLVTLAASAGAGRSNCGVRALFKGPSGTGKTLAARLLARELEMDIYRVDLSAVVNKFIGETEKHLGRLFDRAEETDAVLLFDEGDALFGRRTSVHTSTDRYANLETNFLLQRLESHEGIVLVTTNLGDAIDSAFERRMDVVVDFGLPDAEQRLAIWELHLPSLHEVSGGFLEEVAYRCTLNGGQIRNAALHASLVALAEGSPVRADHAAAAIQREYRKSGAACPLRPEAVT